MHLTPEQIDRFHHDGFLHLRACWPAASFAALRAELTAEIDRRGRELQAGGELAQLHEAAPFERRFGLLHAQNPAIGKGFDVQPLLPASVYELTFNHELLEALSCLLGPEISCNPIQHIRAKPPVDGDPAADRGFFAVPWHQDSGVTTEDADAATLITAWTPIGEATEEMGCLRVIPGMHEHLPHVGSDYGTTIDPALLPTTAPVVLPCREGDVVLMHQFTPHHSTPNRSDRCRWSLDLRFQATGTPSGRAWFPSHVVASADPRRIRRDVDAWRAAWREAMAKPNPGTRHRLAVAG